MPILCKLAVNAARASEVRFSLLSSSLLSLNLFVAAAVVVVLLMAVKAVVLVVGLGVWSC